MPNLRLSRAAALAVPLRLPYRQAIREKLTTLLLKAGKRRARAAVQAYLERYENEILHEDFPGGWAEAMLATGSVAMLVIQGDPGAVLPAGAELVAEVLEELRELDLEGFLARVPGDGSLD